MEIPSYPCQKDKESAANSWMPAAALDIFTQRFVDFIYLSVKGLLTAVESENVYKNNRPCYAESRKKVNTVVHYKFLSLFF
jgi:hypothetical protein